MEDCAEYQIRRISENNSMLFITKMELNAHIEYVAKLLDRLGDLEYKLRDIALFVSVGGFNSDELPDDINTRIKEGIVSMHSKQSASEPVDR